MHVLKIAHPTIQTCAIPAIFVWTVEECAFKPFSILIHSLHVSCRLETSNKVTSQTRGPRKWRSYLPVYFQKLNTHKTFSRNISISTTFFSIIWSTISGIKSVMTQRHLGLIPYCHIQNTRALTGYTCQWNRLFYHNHHWITYTIDITSKRDYFVSCLKN